MSDKYFANTNVLVYAFDSRDFTKQQIAQNRLEILGSSGNLTLSTQVLQEFFVAVTRKLKPPLLPKVAYELVEHFSCYPLVQISPLDILSAIQRHTQDNISFWDALIIESALSSGCNILLSEDMQNRRIIADKLTICDPFS